MLHGPLNVKDSLISPLKCEHEISSEVLNLARHYETSPKKSSGDVCSQLQRTEINT
jgi:hypothetical protein